MTGKAFPRKRPRLCWSTCRAPAYRTTAASASSIPRKSDGVLPTGLPLPVGGALPLAGFFEQGVLRFGPACAHGYPLSVRSRSAICKGRPRSDNDSVATATEPKPRSWLRPRFSLRVLLLAFTAFAVGFPIWYRWPYEEWHVPSGNGGGIPITRVTTWQRQWGGSVVQHGPERSLCAGKTVSLTTYNNGRKHGPHIAYGLSRTSVDGQVIRTDVTTEPIAIGQYVDGKRDGIWIERRGKKQALPIGITVSKLTQSRPISRFFLLACCFCRS